MSGLMPSNFRPLLPNSTSTQSKPSELHGYNLEGQYDIEALNKTGKLDRVVRRIAAPPEAVRKAEKDQHGVVKMLRDLDGDGQMDEAVVWADDLPPCLGIVPARDGVIVTAEPDVIFLADRDGEDPTILEHLGDCLDKLKQKKPAVESWKKALELARKDKRPDKKLIERIEKKLKDAGESVKPSGK